jgi:hypothetical protein
VNGAKIDSSLQVRQTQLERWLGVQNAFTKQKRPRRAFLKGFKNLWSLATAGLIAAHLARLARAPIGNGTEAIGVGWIFNHPATINVLCFSDAERGQRFSMKAEFLHGFHGSSRKWLASCEAGLFIQK